MTESGQHTPIDRVARLIARVALQQQASAAPSQALPHALARALAEPRRRLILRVNRHTLLLTHAGFAHVVCRLRPLARVWNPGKVNTLTQNTIKSDNLPVHSHSQLPESRTAQSRNAADHPTDKPAGQRYDDEDESENHQNSPPIDRVSIN